MKDQLVCKCRTAAKVLSSVVCLVAAVSAAQSAETPLTVSDQASWTAWMQGVDTEEKLAAAKAAVSGKAAVKIAVANFEAGHDDFQVNQMNSMAKYYGLAVEIKQIEPTNPDAGRTLDVVYRDAVKHGDIVIDFKSYWTQDECDRAASVIANCPEKLFILPYGEAGSPVPPTSQSLQGRARHADGSGLANMLLTIPIVKGKTTSLTYISRREGVDDTATAAFVSASGWASGTGDTCQSASMAAIAAAWITAARGDAPSAAEIVRLLEAGRGLPSATDQEYVGFTAADRETLQAKIAEYATADAQGRKKLLNDAPLNIGGVLRQLPEEHVHRWGAWTTTVAATCEGYGYKTRTCSAAGCADREQRQTLLPLGHDWGAWTDDPSDPSRQTRSCVRTGCTATEARAFRGVGENGWGWQKTVTEGTAKYEVLVFTNVADQWTFVLPEGVTAIDYVVVAGGGGGGAGNAYAKIRGGGGGGAGGLLHGTQAGTGRLIASVGKGGAAGKNGFDSTLVFGGVELTAVGGGAGVSDNGNGKDGGSGGGGGGKSSGSKGGAGVEGQGHEGGGYGGGGGGYAAAGTKGKAGAGGAGYEDPISGLTLAVGGRGGTPEGEDGNRNGASGLASTGNGGEGAFGLGWTPGAGGSGAVIVRYLVPGGGDDPHVDPEHPIVPLELSKIFQSNMVIQRDRTVRVWGKGPMGKTVKVTFAGQTATSAAIGEDDLWEVAFTRPFAANATGQKLTATCSDGATITLDDVLVGDVWIAAGQSNMVMPVKGSAYGDTYDAEETVADMANHPQIRWMAMDIGYNQAPEPEPYEVNGGSWGKAAGNLSAVAYHFAHDCVTAHPDIPVGIVGCYCNGLALGYWKPGGSNTLWNRQLAPITRLAVRGAIWYQGESDDGGTQQRDHRYYSTNGLEPMVAAWRREFGAEPADFPFYFVQLAGYHNKSTADDPSGDRDSSYRAVRESMLWARRHIENCGMAVAWDCGRRMLDSEVGTPRIEEIVVHPRCKNVLGKRLALLALKNIYGDDVVAESPYWIRTVTDSQGNIRVKFDMNGSAGFTTALKNWDDAAWPVKTTGEALKGFAVAGSDKVWHWADAVVESKDTIRLSSSDVAKPLYVRYCYRCNPVGGIANGYNEEMLPIAPIATDYDWYVTVRFTEEDDPDVPVVPLTGDGWGYSNRVTIAGTDYMVVTFTNTAHRYAWTLPSGVTKIDYLVVGGGGAGGASGNAYGSGGGGAGGVVQESLAVSSGAALMVRVGRGGASVFKSNSGVAGKDGLGSFLAVGDAVVAEAYPGAGGAGGAQNGRGGSGYACGGGAGGNYNRDSDPLLKGGEGVVSKGGDGKSGAGGGGAGGNGADSTNGGAGGAGVVTTFFDGTELRIAGGGCGTSYGNAGKTTDYGGGATATAGATWGAGGGGGKSSSPSGAGHQGVVVVRYLVSGGDTPTPAHDHVLGPWQLKTAPTCTEDGVSNRVCTATGCDKSAGWEVTAVAPKLGHDFRDDWAVDPDDATKEVRFCHRDGCTASERRVIPLPVTGEDWGYSNKITVAGADYMVVVFTNTEKTIAWTLPSEVTAIDYLVVGGGGSGGRSGSTHGAGGGGAGEMIAVDSAEVSPGSGIAVTVGRGGAGITGTSSGDDGGDSTLKIGLSDLVTAKGGGGGGVNSAGRSGGSGGGAGCRAAGTAAVLAGGSSTRTVGYGNAGGSADKATYHGGGGGGAGGVGSDWDVDNGKGGAGRQSDITGTEEWYAAGGGGAGISNGGYGAGGDGGGGTGSHYVSNASSYNEGNEATAGTTYGSGGGGSARAITDSSSGAGCQGVVIIRYALGGTPEPQPDPVVPGKESKAYETEAAAKAAAPKTVTPSPAVEKAFANPAAREAYIACFAVVTRRNEAGQWVNVAELTETAKEALQQQVDYGAAKVVDALADETVTLEAVTPGFYYGLEYGEDLRSMTTEGQRFELAKDATLTLPLPKTAGATGGFYRVVVSAAPQDSAI